MKDFLCSAHLFESFDGRIYSLKHFYKCKFVHQRTQKDEHYRENPSNHELLTVRGVDRRALLKMFRGQITVYYVLYSCYISFIVSSLQPLQQMAHHNEGALFCCRGHEVNMRLQCDYSFLQLSLGHKYIFPPSGAKWVFLCCVST